MYNVNVAPLLQLFVVHVYMYNKQLQLHMCATIIHSKQ